VGTTDLESLISPHVASGATGRLLSGPINMDLIHCRAESQRLFGWTAHLAWATVLNVTWRQAKTILATCLRSYLHSGGRLRRT
jgi:hypothetical protein